MTNIYCSVCNECIAVTNNTEYYFALNLMCMKCVNKQSESELEDEEYKERQLFQKWKDLAASKITNEKEIEDFEKLVKTIWKQLSFEDRWEEFNSEPSFGEMPRCDEYDCWFNGNMDRLSGYRFSYRLRFTDSAYCEICLDNHTDDAPENTISEIADLLLEETKN